MAAIVDGTNDPFMHGVALEEAQDSAHLDVNLNELDRAVFSSGKLVQAFLATPPVSPKTSDGYWIVGLTATGAWTGHESQVTYWDGNEWRFLGLGSVTAQPTSDANGSYLFAIEQDSLDLVSIVPGVGLTRHTADNYVTYHHPTTINATTSIIIAMRPTGAPVNWHVTDLEMLVTTTTTSDATNHWTIQLQDMNGGPFDLMSSAFDTNGSDFTAETINSLASIDQNNDGAIGPFKLVLTKFAAGDDLTGFMVNLIHRNSDQ